jgi:hypothetical protein
MNLRLLLIITTFTLASNLKMTMAQTRPGLSTDDQEVVPAQSDDPIGALNNYYRALNIGEARTAYKYWENPSQTYEQFMHGFVDTMRVRILVDPSPQIDGAAGSTYAKVASVVISTQRDGSERVFAGCYVMRRSNVRAEDEPQQKGWRIYSASLAPVAGKFSTLLAQRCK